MSDFISFVTALLSAVSKFLGTEPVIYIVMMVIVAIIAKIIKTIIL